MESKIHKTKEWFMKYASVIIVGIFCLKFALLFWSGHPFDFNAFVQTINRHTIYGWNVFEYWNKGNFLIIMWYPFYAVYLIFLQITHIPADQLLLLHFIFKYPFWVMDIACALLVFGLTMALTYSKEKSKIACLLWVCNPIVFYVYGIHGHYELLVAASLLMLFFSLAYDLPVIFGIAFAIAFSTKYFVVILAPLFLIYLLSHKKYTFIIRASITSVFAVVLSYIHFFYHPELIRQTIDSIFVLSQAWDPSASAVVTIPDTNIFSMVHIFLGQGSITNTGAPLWFLVASKEFLYGGLFCVLVYARRCYQSFRLHIPYTLMDIFQDALLVLAGFVILLTNFQWHYVVWFIPFLVILASENEFFLSIFSLLVIPGFFVFFKNEYGPRTFFLDIVQNPNFRTISSMSESLRHLLAVGIIASLFLVVVYLISNQHKKVVEKKKTNISFILIIFALLWCIVSWAFVQIIYQYIREPEKPTALVDQGSQRALIGGVYSSNLSAKSPNQFVFSHSLPNESLVLEGVLPYVERGDTTTFSSYILFSAPPASLSKIQPYFMFNSCTIALSEMRPIRNPIDNTVSLGVPVPITCLAYDNVMTISNSADWYPLDSFHTALFIINHPTQDLYSPNESLFIHIVAGIGILFFIGSIFLFRYCMRVIKRQYEN